MKKILGIFILLVIAAGYVAATDETESIEFADKTPPDALYFVMWTNKAAGTASHTVTNGKFAMWAPYQVRATWGAAVTSTNTIDHVAIITTEQFYNTYTNTDDLGNVQTNYMHGLTNTYTTSITNRIAAWTNTTASSVSEMADRDYIQRGDVLIYTFSDTNSMWYKVTGRR